MKRESGPAGNKGVTVDEQKDQQVAHVPRLSLRPHEAAAALGVSERVLGEWTAAGIIPSIRRGRVRLYSIDVLREWLAKESAADGEGIT